MADDKSKTGNDRKLISLEEDYELRDWIKSLNTTEEKLRAAVKAVGPMAADVEAHLKKGR